jgi:gluconate kinase
VQRSRNNVAQQAKFSWAEGDAIEAVARRRRCRDGQNLKDIEQSVMLPPDGTIALRAR